MSAYQSIKISLIDIPEGRLRDVDQEWAECLAGMFLETGQKTPIDVVTDGKRFSLVAGAHRLTAAKIAKWKEIEAHILEPKPEQAADELRLHEILENLGRKDFNALERCEALSELKRVYENLHPGSRHGGDRKSQAARNKQENQVAIFAFCQNAAESTGLSDRSVRLAVQIFEGLSPQSRERLRGTAFAEKQSDLKALSTLSPDNQVRVLDVLLSEMKLAGSVSEAIQMLRGEEPQKEAQKLFERASNILPKLPKASLNNVFRQHKKAIIALVKSEGWLDE